MAKRSSELQSQMCVRWRHSERWVTWRGRPSGQAQAKVRCARPADALGGARRAGVRCRYLEEHKDFWEKERRQLRGALAEAPQNEAAPPACTVADVAQLIRSLAAEGEPNFQLTELPATRVKRIMKADEDIRVRGSARPRR
jgi:hypothetical protein